MALLTTPKAASVNSNTPSKTIVRQEVSVARPTASSARAEALKNRLTGKTPSQPVAPRPAGSSARRDEMSKVQKYTSSPQVPAAPAKPVGSPKPSSARQGIQDFSDVELPPGVQPQSEDLSPTPNSIESTEPVAEANSEPLSPQFVALARQEKQLRKARLELKAEQDAWKQEQEKYIPKDRLTSETLKVLTEAGITSDKLVELQINQASSQDPQQLLLNRIAELESKLTGIIDPENGEFSKRDKQQYDQVVGQIRQDAKLLVDSNPNFGTIKSEGKLEDVVGLITRVFDEEGVALDVEEAAEIIENKLIERLTSQYERLSKYDKIQAKFRKVPEVPEASPEQPPQQTQNKFNTLTQAGASTRPLTARERAILIVQEKLNSNKR